MTEGWKVIRVGWFGFEGFGRPWEAWSHVPLGVSAVYVSESAKKPTGWQAHGRSFTRRGAQRRARLALADRVGTDQA